LYLGGATKVFLQDAQKRGHKKLNIFFVLCEVVIEQEELQEILRFFDLSIVDHDSDSECFESFDLRIED